MQKILLNIIVPFAMAAFSIPSLSQTPFESNSQCLENLLKDPEIAILRNKLPLLGEEPTPFMFSLNRKVLAAERKALEKYIKQSDVCWNSYRTKINLPHIDRAAPTNVKNEDKFTQLRDGVITFADFALAEVKTRIEFKYAMENWEKEQKKREELAKVINLSCVAESGRASGVEFQYQIDEVAKTIWASRGAEPPSKVNIGPTSITFNQGDFYIAISRSTGRFSQSASSTLITGVCETIKQAKF
jgi:hypothetical protein